MSLVCLHRFWQYELFYDSFGLFDSVIWQVSRFQAPVIDHLALGRLHPFADHFYPTVFLLAPLYWITTRSEMLLVIQTLAVSLGGLVLFAVGKHITKNGWFSFALTVSYLLFIGIQNAVIADFHEITVATLPLMLVFWAVATNRKKLFYLFLVLALGCKESMAFTGVGIGIFLLFQRGWRKQAFITVCISVLWGYLAIRYVIPFFSHGVYLYSPALPNEPIHWITRLFDDPEKRKTLLYSFQSFLYLPLFAPTMWPLIISDFIMRFVPYNSGGHWTLGMHYNALTGVYLAVASLFGIRHLRQWMLSVGRKRLFRFDLIKWAIPLALIANSLFLHQRVLHGPLGLSYNPVFYRHTKNFAFLNDLVNQIPNNVSVMTQSNLSTRFTRQPLYLLDINYDQFSPDYIVMDLREGQNPNNFFGMHGASISRLLEKIVDDPAYGQIYAQGGRHIWKKIK